MSTISAGGFFAEGAHSAEQHIGTGPAAPRVGTPAGGAPHALRAVGDEPHIGQSDPTVQPVPASVVQQVDAADSTLSNPRRAVVSVGSNLGNRLDNLQGAVDALEDTPGLRVRAVSPVYETEPWGVEPDSQPSYYNAIVVVKTTLPPTSLLERAHAVEEAFHRERTEHWGPRTLDVDIVTYADMISDDPALTLPHPRAHERAFVLVPWYDIEPEAQLPGHGPVSGLLAHVTREGVVPRPDLELRLPE